MMMRNKLVMICVLCAALFAVGCSSTHDDEALAPLISGLKTEYVLFEDEVLELNPIVENNEEAVYHWAVNNTVVANTQNYVVSNYAPGIYNLVFKVSNRGGEASKEISVVVANRNSVPIISDLESFYVMQAGGSLELNPSVLSEDTPSFVWLLGEEKLAETKECRFTPTTPGKYKLVFKAVSVAGETERTIDIFVNGEIDKSEISTYTILTLDTPDYVDKTEMIAWEILKAPSELCRLTEVSSLNPMFIAAKNGEYLLQVTDGEITLTKKIVVKDRKNLSAYISKVYDYLPAPGQFVNKLPEYELGDTHADMVKKAGDWLVGEDAYMITLGGWGGYVTFGFDHTIVNVAGKRDFRIHGNAFGSALGRPGAPFGGSCEPGIIMVAYDKNHNGKPDEDEWYEIVGSASFSAKDEPWYDYAVENSSDTRVFRDYEMTYYKPSTEEPELSGEPDDPNAFAVIDKYIRWTDNQNNRGYKVKNIYHEQTYYPAWRTESKLTYKGVRLPENGINEGKYTPGINEAGVYYVLYGFRYGYVDNYPNTHDNSAIDIDWAIDKDGKKVHLPGIDFVKVYNGVNQENGWIGESSTEVERGMDLHMLGKSIDTISE